VVTAHDKFASAKLAFRARDQVRQRYGLGEIAPICGEHAPLPVDPAKLQ
jgi:hypothetical protein